ncbi:GNAT family N-acetyltransferase [Micromonospora zingiberis]|uniref:GNAT family N-acetyltransferase n=1 Tax=Micromonospora zingiberis TaxID=2053011 RepID=A0A4R0G9J1_9ACTN|nr:GNAT family N-acetyltransferase [Micromonospora zingiberis]TCB93366.1 GNAT family N-acetyltransferase [Micromonospora zingiberis]
MADLQALAIRFSAESDASRLEELQRGSWIPTVTPAGPYEPRSFFHHHRPDEVLVAVNGALPIGYIVVRRASQMASHAHVASIDGLGVAAASRRQGVAGALLRAAERVTAERGFTRLTLRVLSCNVAALALYARHGFETEGVLRGEFQLPVGPGGGIASVDDILLAKRVV